MFRFQHDFWSRGLLLLLLCVLCMVMMVMVVMLLIVLVHEVIEPRSRGAKVLERLLERLVISLVIVTDKLMGVTLRASWRKKQCKGKCKCVGRTF
jgi:cytochrome c biogenesis factor